MGLTTSVAFKRFISDNDREGISTLHLLICPHGSERTSEIVFSACRVWGECKAPQIQPRAAEPLPYPSKAIPNGMSYLEEVIESVLWMLSCEYQKPPVALLLESCHLLPKLLLVES